MKEYVFGKECRQEIFKGIDLMYQCVSATLGSYGRNALIDRIQVVDLTKDGVTVAEEVASNKWENMGCNLVRVASQNTNDEAGDGTTTAIVLARDMCKLSLDLPDNVRVLSVKAGMQKAVDACVEHLKLISVMIDTKDEFLKVATVSAQDKEVAKIVTDAFMNAGSSGSIEIERADEPGIEVEKTDGISFEKGWVLPHSINNPAKQEAIGQDVPVIVTDRKLTNHLQLVPILESIVKELQEQKVMVIADDFSDSVKGLIATNAQKGSFHIIAVRAPSYGHNKIEIMKDICAATGAMFISEENAGLKVEKAKIEHVGKAKKIIVGKEKTVILAEDGIQFKKAISDRIDKIKVELEDEKDEMIIEDLETRLATLTDGITVIKVGGQTNQEFRELKHRVEDAVRALGSAREEGVVVGGGVALLRCVEALEGLDVDGDEALGVEIVRKALHSPALKILDVASIEDKEHIIAKIKESDDGTGYSFMNHELGDLLDEGIYDATKVVRCALQNAASCAKNFLSLDCAILNVPENEETLRKLGEILAPKQ